MINVVEGDIRCMSDVVVCYRYRISENNDNYMAFQKKKNISDEDYLTMLRLEKWALENKRIRLNLETLKTDRFVASVVVWMKNPTIENCRVVRKIWGYSKKPIKYSFYLVKTIIIKEFYWKVRKLDKMIRI